jgi:hypothetical protein
MPVIRRKKYKSLDLKCALINYFKYKRNMICADEVTVCGNYIADILADNGSKVYEIEIKTDVHDLTKNEINNKKQKHDMYKKSNIINMDRSTYPNLFYFCVPENLLKEAEETVDKINPNYGIMIYKCFRDDQLYSDRISVYRQAKKLKDNYKSVVGKLNRKLEWEVLKRLDLEVKLRNIKEALK